MPLSYPELQKKIKTEQKTISASVWAAKDYPISVETLQPLFHVLSFASKNISKFNEFISK
jgi:hypothetical protein